MDVLHECEIVGQQGRAAQLGEEPRTGMTKGQQAGDGEATAGAWLGGLTQLCL